jgi:hypothetical protein
LAECFLQFGVPSPEQGPLKDSGADDDNDDDDNNDNDGSYCQLSNFCPSSECDMICADQVVFRD